MLNQDEFYFGRTMDPCDYNAELAREENSIIIEVKDGGRKRKREQEKGGLNEK